MLMNLRPWTGTPSCSTRCGSRAAMLPEIRPAIGVLRHHPGPGARRSAIGALIGDQQASLFGQTAFDAGEAKCTFGTGSFLLLNTGTEIVRSSHGLITTVAHKVGGEPATYALEGSVARRRRAGPVVPRQPGLIRTPAEIETLAATVADNGGCYVVPAFSGLFAPHWEQPGPGASWSA